MWRAQSSGSGSGSGSIEADNSGSNGDLVDDQDQDLQELDQGPPGQVQLHDPRLLETPRENEGSGEYLIEPGAPLQSEDGVYSDASVEDGTGSDSYPRMSQQTPEFLEENEGADDRLQEQQPLSEDEQDIADRLLSAAATKEMSDTQIQGVVNENQPKPTLSQPAQQPTSHKSTPLVLNMLASPAQSSVDIPIRPGIGSGGRALTFEELVERAMKQGTSGQQRDETKQPDAASHQPFLKKGEGTRRPPASVLARQKSPNRSMQNNSENNQPESTELDVQPAKTPTKELPNVQKSASSGNLEQTKVVKSFSSGSLQPPREDTESPGLPTEDLKVVISSIEQNLLAGAKRPKDWAEWKRAQDRELEEFEELECQVSHEEPEPVTGQIDKNVTEIFDDEEAWGSVEDPLEEQVPAQPFTKAQKGNTGARASLSPASTLVARVFKAAQNKYGPLTVGKKANSEAVISNVKVVKPIEKQQQPTPPEDLASERQKLQADLVKYKQDNEKLKKLKEEYEQAAAQLKAERTAFEKEKVSQREQFEQFKEEELKKIKRDKTRSVARKSASERKLHDDFEALQAQYSQLQAEFKTQKSKYQTMLDRAKRKIEDLSSQITELQQELRFHEERALAVIDPKPVKKKSLKPKEQKPIPSDPLTAEESSSDNTSPIYEPTAFAEIGWLPREVTSPRGDIVISENTGQEGKIEKIHRSGRKTLIFSNGTRKDILPSGHICVYFKNGDIKQVPLSFLRNVKVHKVFPDGRNIYYYASANTAHTTYLDGLEVFYFSNNQVEKHFPDGRKEISFPDKTKKTIFANGEEENVFPDGTVQRLAPNGDCIITFQNGHQGGVKKKIYPDGTTKIILPSGHTQVLYAATSGSGGRAVPLAEPPG